MLMRCSRYHWLVCFLCLYLVCRTNTEENKHNNNNNNNNNNIKPENGEKYYNEIRNFHKEMDNNNDGEINMNESAEYMKTQLKVPSGTRTRQSSQFHKNDDHISVDDLWKKWLESPTYLWSVDDVLKWLDNTVRLPQYAHIFRTHRVTGKNMPQLATDKSRYLKDELKISNKLDRKKISLHASTLILFGVDEVQVKEDTKKFDPNYDAMKALHVQLDDDLDGEISSNESNDFVIEDLQSEVKPQHATMHSLDSYISLDEFWHQWEHSEVFNWTNDQVVLWLRVHVGLPEYESVFREKKLFGECIPRLATDDTYLQKELGIVVGKHRKKINLRASEIILFGLPEGNSNFINDTIVFLTVSVASLLIFYAFHQKSMSKKEIEKLTNDLEFLKQAELQLRELQENEETTVSNETELLLREQIEEAKKETERLHQEKSKHEEEKTKLQLLEQEVYDLRRQLVQAKKDKTSEARQGAPLGLQSLLMMTYRKEVQNFHLRKQQALLQMQVAKEACEKVNKTRRAVFGSLRLAHGQSIDAVDQKILNAKTALAEVTKDLQERQSRWQQIEGICDFSVVNEEMNMQRVMLSDSLLFGSKGQVGSLEGYDSPLLGLTESEQLDQLDNEVEAITRKGRLMRSGTESSSSPENPEKNGLSRTNASPQKTPNHVSSPKVFKRNPGVKSNSSYDSLSLHSRGSTSSLDTSADTSFHTSLSAPSVPNLQNPSSNDVLVKRRNLPSYTRSNTDPNVGCGGGGTREGIAENNDLNGCHSPNLADLSTGKSRSGSRPVSMIEKDTKKKKKGLSLGRFGSNNS